MGCSNGKLETVPVCYPDNRVPFTKEEIEDLQDVWGMIKHRFEDAAKDNLMR